MPVYKYSLTVPANTPTAKPKRLDAEVEEGVITKIEVFFPPGPHGMVKTRCLHGRHQIWPKPKDAVLDLDDCTIVIPEYYPLPHEPFTFTLEGWSPGTDYEHTITWLFYTLPRLAAAPWLILQHIYALLKKVFGVPARA